MSRRDWVRKLFIWALIGIALLAAYVVLDSTDYKLEQGNQRQVTAPRPQYAPEDAEREACRHVSGHANYFNCIAEQQRAQREEQRAQHDLRAQQEMAFWTYLLTWIGVGGLGLTGFGIYYVVKTFEATWQTLRETETANEEARDRTRRELRAYLSVEPDGIIRLVGSDHGMGHVAVRNVGKLPARRVEVFVSMKIADRPEADFPVPADPKIVKRTIQPEAEMRQGSAEHFPQSQFDNPGDYIFVWGVVYYYDGYKKRRFTRFCHRYNAESFQGSAASRTLLAKETARYHETGNEAK